MHKERQYSPEKWTEMEILILTIFEISTSPWCALETNHPHSVGCLLVHINPPGDQRL